jgi:dTDP-4-dehydrorhamnose reductase
VILIGSRGMLGQMAARYFSNRATELVIIDERFTYAHDCPGLAVLSNAGPGIVINTLGRIKQKSSDMADLMLANALLPLQIYERLAEGQFLVQPSTDCVFNGLGRTPYRRDDPADAVDDYGFSKRLGEVAVFDKMAAAVVRVSIIGPDWLNAQPSGLLGWFLSQPTAARLCGYTNHWWNGITTLEWCKQIERLFVSGDIGEVRGRLIQLGVDTVITKYELLLAFQAAFKTDFEIVPTETDSAVYRVLETDIDLPSISEQLAQLRNFADNAP